MRHAYESSCLLADVTFSGSQRPIVSTAMRTFEPFFRLAPTYAPQWLLSGVLCSVQLSMTAAVGLASWPVAIRKSPKGRAQSPRRRRLGPALDLMLDGGPRPQVVREHATRGARPHDPAEGVVDLAKILLPLRRILADQREIGRDELLLVILDVRRIRLPCRALSLAGNGREA